MRLKIPITPNMAPFCHIVLVYITNKGELVAAEKEIKVDNVLCNFVKITAAPQETQPGKETSITIESKPNSIVGLMGVDQSAILLKKGNDISREDVENDLRGYDNTWFGNTRTWGRSRRSTIGWLPGYSVRDIFSRAGSVILTNAYLPEEKFMEQERHLSVRSVKSMSVKPKSESRHSLAKVVQRTYSSTGQLSPVIMVRSNFIETWIWDLFELRHLLMRCVSVPHQICLLLFYTVVLLPLMKLVSWKSIHKVPFSHQW
uniref:Alpha-2-macroglobulin n=2 Tax=Lygus hesperus TaxID=30085 RepID=A0A0A9WTD5_LYGHE